MQKTRFSPKLSNLELWSLLTTYRWSYIGFSRNPLLDPKNPRWLSSVILKIVMTSFFHRRRSDLDKISQTGAEWHVDCGDIVEIETRCRILICGGRLGEFSGMSSQSHLPHCRVQSPGEINVISATLQGVRIPSAILKIVFRHILFFLNEVWVLTSGGFRIVSDTLVYYFYSVSIPRERMLSVPRTADF